MCGDYGFSFTGSRDGVREMTPRERFVFERRSFRKRRRIAAGECCPCRLLAGFKYFREIGAIYGNESYGDWYGQVD